MIAPGLAGAAGMSGGDCAQTRPALGVYLLGAIKPHERVQLADQLASCLACHEKLAALAMLPALLQKVPADEAIRAWMDDSTDQPPGPPLETLLARAGRRESPPQRAYLDRRIMSVEALCGSWNGIGSWSTGWMMR